MLGAHSGSMLHLWVSSGYISFSAIRSAASAISALSLLDAHLLWLWCSIFLHTLCLSLYLSLNLRFSKFNGILLILFMLEALVLLSLVAEVITIKLFRVVALSIILIVVIELLGVVVSVFLIFLIWVCKVLISSVVIVNIILELLALPGRILLRMLIRTHMIRSSVMIIQ